MKRNIIIFIRFLLGIGSVMASGIMEYNGQNYFTGMMTSNWAISYALYGVDNDDEEMNYFYSYTNIINDNKYFFIESLTDNFDIKERIIKNGFIEHNEEIFIKELVGVLFIFIENEKGELQRKYIDFECIYDGEKIYYNPNMNLSITIIGYAIERKIIITEIILTNEEFERRENEFRIVNIF
jgi:hypothetical protein